MRLPAQLLKRKPDTHKGDYGSVLIVGGSPGLTGAVCLAARAALRVGSGIVRAGIPETLNAIFEKKLTEEMTLPLKDLKGGYLSVAAYDAINKIREKIDVLAIGPGASQNRSAAGLMRKITLKIDRSLVIDADGLNALAGHTEVLAKRKNKDLILTPHLGEFSRILKISTQKIKKNRKELALGFARRYNLILVLKGHCTLVTNGKTVFENSTGNPGMATAGMGDVLTGMIAGLIAQGIESFTAAKTGVYLHGRAADLAVKDKTESCLIASDVIDYLPRAIKKSE